MLSRVFQFPKAGCSCRHFVNRGGSRPATLKESVTRHLIGVVAVVVLLAGVRQAQSETGYFMGPDNGSWHVPDNWSFGRLPGASDEVRIFDDLTVVVDGDVSTNQVIVGYYQDGHVIQESGDFVANSLHLGWGGDDGYTGIYDLLGGRADINNLKISGGDGDSAFALHGGRVDIEDLYVGWKGTFTLHDGDVVVNTEFAVGHQSGNFFGIFDQLGGTVSSNATLELGTMTGAESDGASYRLSGGELTITASTPFRFGSGEDVYFDFRGGALTLPDIWDYSRLASRDFRVFGEPATEENLEFNWVIVNEELHTRISAVPEPGTLTLLGMGAIGLLVYGWRRRRL